MKKILAILSAITLLASMSTVAHAAVASTPPGAGTEVDVTDTVDAEFPKEESGNDDAEKPGDDDAEKPGEDDAEKPGEDDAEKPGDDDAEKPGKGDADDSDIPNTGSTFAGLGSLVALTASTIGAVVAKKKKKE